MGGTRKLLFNIVIRGKIMFEHARGCSQRDSGSGSTLSYKHTATHTWVSSSVTATHTVDYCAVSLER